MSAKLTIIFFILICFEIGALLIILPWVPNPSWNENYLLVLAADKLNWPSLAGAMKSPYLRGAVTGLGVVNILLGLIEPDAHPALLRQAARMEELPVFRTISQPFIPPA